MAKQLQALTEKLSDFIRRQHVFFVATAPGDGKINLSPKGLDSLRILEPNRLIWLSLTGSGNETAAHVLENGRMTMMFCAFGGHPLILRLYGKAKCIYRDEGRWTEYAHYFPEYLSARQIFELDIEMVQTSCGFAVPLMTFQNDRDQLLKWADHRGEEGINEFWEKKNALSLDGIPTGIK